MMEQRFMRVPEVELPLRASLPEFNAGTYRRLIAFGFRQWTVAGPWLVKRALRYWTEHDYPPDLRATDELHQRLDATAALDLLEWQSNAKSARAAVDWLKGVDEMREAV